MTLALTLPRFQQLGKQTASGVYEMGSGVTGHLPLVTAATISNKGGDPEGVNFEFLAIYNDQTVAANQPVFAVMKGDYSLDNGKHLLTRTSVLYSSNGNTGNVDFAAGTDNIRFIGIASHEHFEFIKDRGQDVRILQRIKNSDSTDRFITKVGSSGGTDTYDPITDVYIVTPKSQSSTLSVKFQLRCRLHSLVSTNDARAYFFSQFKNSSGLFLNRGNTQWVGFQNYTPESPETWTDIIANFETYYFQADQNLSNQWEVRSAGYLNYTNNRLSCFDYQIILEEFE